MDFSFVKTIKDEDIKKYVIKPVGGRACYYWIHYCLIHNYTKKLGKWPLLVGVIGDSVNNIVKWIYLWPKDIDLEKYLQIFISDITVLTDIEEHIKKQVDAIQDALIVKPLSELTNSELASLMTTAFEKFSNCSYLAASLRFVDLGVQNYFNDKFKDDPRLSDIIRLVGVPQIESFSIKEEIELLNLAKKVRDKSISDEELITYLNNIKDNYCWYVCGYFNEKAKTIIDYKKAIEEILRGDIEKRISDIDARILKENKDRMEILDKLDTEQSKVAEIASKATYLKDYYKFISNKIIYILEPLFEEISKRVDESVEYIKSLDYLEISQLLNGKKVDSDYLKERLRHNTMIAYEGHFSMRVGDDADKFGIKFLSLDSGGSEFRGRIASKGYVKGKARIVRSSNDFHKINDGDILVVINTTPDYVPVLKRVAGIVAEEGGITAHVSVISREFGLPAVVGVHRITEILSDGCDIEIDANKGVVRIIK